MTNNNQKTTSMTRNRLIVLSLCSALALCSLPALAAYQESVSYDSHGFVASRTDLRGITTTFTRDSAGRELSRTEAYGTSAARTISTQWDTTLNVPLQITRPDRIISFSYDSRGLLLQRTITDRTTNASRTVSFSYDNRSRLVSMDGPRTDVSDITTYSYDSQSNLSAITNSLGQVTTISDHDGMGRPLTVVDPNSLVTHLSYDARGRLISREVGGEVTRYGYDQAGNLVSVTTPDGAVLNYSYDAAHRLIAIVDGDGNRIDYTLDAMDNRVVQNVHDRSGTLLRTARASFNTFNELVQTTGAAGQLASYSYDGNGNVTAQVDPNSNATAYAYDPLNRLVQVSDPLGGIVRTQYDSADQPVAVIDADGHTTRYHYNGFGDLIEQDSPDSGTTTYTYDAAGNVISRTDAKGQTTSYSYDVLNRVTQQTRADGSVISYLYDTAQNGIGRLAVTTAPSGTTSYSYDQHGRVTARVEAIATSGSLTQLTTRYAYNGNGQLQQLTYPSGHVVGYQYTGNGKVSALTLDGQPLLGNITWEAFGPVTSWQWSNGSSYSRSFDQDGQLVSHSEGNSQKSLSYDPAGNITAIGSASFSYDALNRLIAANDAAFDLSWQYDANGNRLQASSGWLQSTSYTLDASSNRLLAVDGTNYQYDANGSLISDGQKSYKYDSAGRLISVDNGTTATYRYNALGQRIYKQAKIVVTDTNGDGVINTADLQSTITSPNAPCTTLSSKLKNPIACVANQIGTFANNGKSSVSQAKSAAFIETRLFDYDGWQLLGEYNTNGTAAQETVWLGSLPVATLQNGSVYNIYPDHLGAPRVITNSANTVVWRWDSEPFGSNKANEDPDGNGVRFTYNLRFPGQYYDGETGKHYNYFRDYDPTTGRYVESDPIGLRAGLNTYGYVSAKPLNRYDSIGLAEEEEPAAEVLEPSVPEMLAASRVNDLITQIREYDPSYTYQVDAAPGYRYNSNDVEYLENILRQRENANKPKACPVSGGGASLDYLDPSQIQRIQNAATRSGQEINLVGSRAGGTARQSSDWDYVIDANARTRNSLSHSLPGAGNATEGVRPNIDIFRGTVDETQPYIRFFPRD